MKTKSAVLTAKEEFMRLYYDGQFPAESKLPSENEMAVTLGVSRETWRKALKLLRGEGILASRHGSGTYVLPHNKKIPLDLAQLQSMNKMIAASGIKELKAKTSCKTGPAPEEVCSFFQVPEGTEFYCVKKIRYADTGSICSCINYFPMQYGTSLNPKHIPSSLFSYLEQTYSLKLTQAYTLLDIASKKDMMRELLDLPEGKEAFVFRQIYYDAKGNPVLYSIDYLRSDLFQLSLMRTAP